MSDDVHLNLNAQAFRGAILAEITAIKQATARMRKAQTADIEERMRTYLVAASLHETYSGLERCFLRVQRRLTARLLKALRGIATSCLQ